MTAVVALQGVAVDFGPVQALRGVDLRIQPGDRVALIGANGSGKSTLLRVLNGLVAPTSGSVLRDAAARQAMVFQRPFMLRASALENVALGLRLHGTRKADAHRIAAEALERVGLSSIAQQDAQTLSGGQQQRLAMARAWALDPDVLLLDEPTASLDPRARLEVEDLIADFASWGMTVVFASHNLGQVKRLASRAVYMEGGRILADAGVHEFFDRSRLPALSPQADRFVAGEIA